VKRRKTSPRKKNECEICGAPASHVCPICGRVVCDKHWAGDKCVICAETICALCGKRLAIAACAICGRPVCEECSIQVNPVVRVCVECAEKYSIETRDWPPRDIVELELRKLSTRLEEFIKRWRLIARS